MSADGQPGLAARRAALAALAAVEERDAYSNLAVPDAVAALPDARDRALASHLAYDALRWQGTLDWALSHHSRRPLADVEAPLRRVLRLGALQLLRTSVPARAAVSTAATLAGEAVPRARRKGATGFVNGVLRSLARDIDRLPWPDPEREPERHLVLTTAHPTWVVRDLVQRLGAERAGAVLAADNDPPGTTLRARGDRDALIAELAEAGVEARPGAHPAAVRAPGADPRRLAAVREGRARVQDEASMRVASATGAAAGERVLDLCAGPGGKTSMLADLVGATGRVDAVEQHPHRARLVEEAVADAPAPVEVLVGDARELPVTGDYDAVLLDAPCTGLGTGRRRPEVRWRRAATDASDLARLQRDLLAAAATRLAPGGRLVYSVCTWTRAETDPIVDDALARTDLVEVERRLLLPDADDTDGMFYAVLERRAVAGAR